MGLVLSRKSLAELYQLRASWNIFEDQSSWAKQRLWRWAGWLPAVVLQTLDWQICTNWTTWIGKFAQFGQLGLAGWLPAVVVHGLAERFQLCRSFLEVRLWPLFLFTKFKGHGAAKLADLSITLLAEA